MKEKMQKYWLRAWEVFVEQEAPKAAELEIGCVYHPEDLGGKGQGCTIGCQEEMQDFLMRVSLDATRKAIGNLVFKYPELQEYFGKPGDELNQFCQELQATHDSALNWTEGKLNPETLIDLAKKWNLERKEQ